MKKQRGNIAVYVLAIALVVTSAINANQAQSHSRDTAKIRTLEREISSLRSCLNSNLDDVSRLLSRGSDNWRYFNRRC
jgi:hypothetical protein